MNYNIIPSIIARSQAELETRLKKILALKPKQVHLDIMDGLFVKRTSLEFDISLPKSTAYEAHLMMRDPHGWFVKNRVSISSAIIHYESKAHIHDFIKLAKKYKKSFGIALNPESAFYKEARKRALGRPVTGEIDLGEYRLQGFDKAILTARLFFEDGVVVGGDWGNMQVVEWLG